MSHTPGPWKTADDEGAAFVYALNDAGTNRFFLSVQPGWTAEGPRNRPEDARTSDTECAANARLIAAAPELLAAAKKYMETCPADYDTTRAFKDASAALTAAIAKAEGK